MWSVGCTVRFNVIVESQPCTLVSVWLYVPETVYALSVQRVVAARCCCVSVAVVGCLIARLSVRDESQPCALTAVSACRFRTAV